MMKLSRPLAIAALGIALAMPTLETADAQRRTGRIIGGVAAGIVAGAIIAGAASSARAEPAYRSDCRDLRRQAIWNEERGRNGRAQYYWDRYAECRGE